MMNTAENIGDVIVLIICLLLPLCRNPAVPRTIAKIRATPAPSEVHIALVAEGPAPRLFLLDGHNRLLWRNRAGVCCKNRIEMRPHLRLLVLQRSKEA